MDVDIDVFVNVLTGVQQASDQPDAKSASNYSEHPGYEVVAVAVQQHLCSTFANSMTAVQGAVLPCEQLDQSLQCRLQISLCTLCFDVCQCTIDIFNMQTALAFIEPSKWLPSTMKATPGKFSLCNLDSFIAGASLQRHDICF